MSQAAAARYLDAFQALARDIAARRIRRVGVAMISPELLAHLHPELPAFGPYREPPEPSPTPLRVTMDGQQFHADTMAGLAREMRYGGFDCSVGPEGRQMWVTTAPGQVATLELPMVGPAERLPTDRPMRAVPHVWGRP